MARVRIGEQQVKLAGAQLAIDGINLALELAGELRVVLGQLVQLDEVFRTALEPVPGLDLFPKIGRLAGVTSGLPRIVPDTRLG
jgi:hypothetical protein